ETDSFEEERVLESAVVFEVRVLAEGGVQVAHAEGEVLLGEGVDAGGGDGRAGERWVEVGEGGVRGGEVFGEVR
ncbi:MAG: hypothetical protein Q9190_001660, partial [Brigantiaea leucoxantha]